MTYFLAKTDPASYSIDDFEREGTTVWDGVRNALACRAIRLMSPGDDVFIYHSQGTACVVGLALVVSEPRPDVTEPKSFVVDMTFKKQLTRPVTLKEIKASNKFNSWILVRQGRLSTMEAPDEFAEWLGQIGAI